ncbi:MAG: hypothetical protein IT454_21880 [Planctomycetes bacterium]|nr:hypothetical protein [Planctomycetota bacterium]
MSKLNFLWLLALPLILASCVTHRVQFEDLQPRVAAAHQAGSLTVVIDAATRAHETPIKSAMAGMGNTWIVQSGRMLVQMSDTEFPKLYGGYTLLEAAPASSTSPVLYLGLASYSFADLHANVTLTARATDAGGKLLLEKSYSGTGETQGGKMFWGGAFAMRSALRQSSHTAFAQAFEALLKDLAAPAP